MEIVAQKDKVKVNGWKLLFVISGFCLTGILPSGSFIDFRSTVTGILISDIIALFLWVWIAAKTDYVDKLISTTYTQRTNLLYGLMSITTAYYFWQNLSSKTLGKVMEFASDGMVPTPYLGAINSGIQIVSIVATLLSLYTIFILSRWLYSKLFLWISSVVRSFSPIERRCFLITFLTMALVLGMIYSITNVFTTPTYEGAVINWNVIFTSDTGNLVNDDVFTNISAGQNDIRQPLFGLFTLPIGIMSHLLAGILFFLPLGYGYFLALFQLAAMLFIIILMTRMSIGTDGPAGVAVFLVMLFSYPTLLFLFNVEQYVFVVFWLVLFIYISLTEAYNSERQFLLFTAATGSLLTSGITFIGLFNVDNIRENGPDWPQHMKQLIIAFLTFMSIVFLSGKGEWFLHIKDSADFLMKYSGEDLLFADKFMQYTCFVKTCFVAPDVIIDRSVFPAMRMMEASRISVVGIILFALAILSSIINWKKIFVKISLVWVLFSIIMLLGLGWGTCENGLVLYSLYFGWAYWCLLLTFIGNIVAWLKLTHVQTYIYGGCAVVLFLLNLSHMVELIKFGLTYYPL